MEIDKKRPAVRAARSGHDGGRKIKIMHEIILTQKNNKVMATSNQVAEHFGKDHKNVLQAIQNLVAENSAAKLLFMESEYSNRGKKYPCYLMNRDGFSLLVMGFTGAEALQWKLKYIKAFNEMESQINNGLPSSIDYKKLPPTNRMASILLRTVKLANANPISIASTIFTMYRQIGVPVPALEAPTTSEWLTASEIAEKVGVMSTTGNPHGQAVSALLALLDIPDEYKQLMTYERNGHSGSVWKYKPEIVDKVVDWMTDKQFPVPLLLNSKQFKVTYRR